MTASITSTDAIQQAVLALLLAAKASSTSLLASAKVGEDIEFDNLPTGTDAGVQVSHVRDLPSYPYAGGTAPVQWQTTLRISTGVRGDRRGAQGRPSMLLLDEVHRALMADAHLAGQGLSNIVQGLQMQELRPDLDTQSAARIGVVDALYTVIHQTPADSLEAPAP